MEAMIARGEFLEYARVHNKIYGTSIAGVRAVADTGKTCLLDIDVQGAALVKKTNLNARFIFISPPALNVLEARLRGRGTESEKEIAVRLGRDREHPLQVGDVFEMNDRRAEIVAIVKAKQGQGGASYVFTTFDRAREYGFSQRKMTTHVLAAPQPGLSAEEAARRISRETGLRAYTEAQFKQASSNWMLTNTPIPFVVGLIVGIGFLVGIIVAGQTFYNFVLENTRYLGALKAMGASNARIARMTVLQAGIVGLTGYGIGMGLLTIFFRGLPEGRAPLLLQWPVAVIVFAAVTVIVAFASLLGIRRVTGIESAIVFRS
jgi:putative ABC transport system permease protein